MKSSLTIFACLTVLVSALFNDNSTIYVDKKYGEIFFHNPELRIFCYNSHDEFGLYHLINNTGGIAIFNLWHDHDFELELSLNNCLIHSSGDTNLDITKKLYIKINALTLNPNINHKLERKQFKGLTLKSLKISGGVQNFEDYLLYDLPMLENLEISSTNGTMIPDKFFEKSTNLKELELNFNYKLSKIKENDFFSLAKLEFLHLIGNEELVEIDKKSFDHLIALRGLSIEENIKLETLPDGILKNLNYLKVLRLTANKINSLPDNLLYGLKNLISFSFYDNRGYLPSLPGGFFKDLEHLVGVHLSNNNFSSIPEDLFLGPEAFTELNTENLKQDRCLSGNKLNMTYEQYTNLYHLDLSHNRLTQLFIGPEFPNLQTLKADNNKLVEIDFCSYNLLDVNLDNNQLTTLSSLNKLPLLDDLSVTNNNLKIIDFRIKHLRKVDLSNNHLTTIVLEEEMPNLKELVISHNNLKKIDVDLCKKASSLESLDLSFNNIPLSEYNNIDLFFDDDLEERWIENVLVNCESISELKLHHNNITEFPYWKKERFNAMRVLHLEYNNISEINLKKLVMYYKDLSQIYLEGSKLKTVSVENYSKNKTFDTDLLLHKHRTNVIIFEDSQVYCDCKINDFLRFLNKTRESMILDNLPAISYYDMTCSGPTEFKNRPLLLGLRYPDEFIDVRELYCEDNNCVENCTCVDYPENKVIKIDCSSKNFTILRNKIFSFINSKTGYEVKLNLSNNELLETPDLSNCSGKITSLDLSHNKIFKVTVGILSYHLQELKLDNNLISSLDDDVLDAFDNRSMKFDLFLHDNPWKCDCKAIRFSEFLQNSTKVREIGKIKCFGSELNNIFDQNRAQNIFLLCYLPYLIKIIVLSILLVVSAAFYYKYKKEIKIWLYSRRYCLWFVAEDEVNDDKKSDSSVENKSNKNLGVHDTCLHNL